MIGVAMNKDEALKMAIEALEQAEKQLIDYWNADIKRGYYIEEMDDTPILLCKDTIESCKEALNIANCDLKQPAQEPVATVRSYNGLVGFHANQKQINILKDKHEHPLYLHPHQWQGLTDDEILAIPVGSRLSTARAIEQALKEKNT
jgi:hypothetical protein